VLVHIVSLADEGTMIKVVHICCYLQRGAGLCAARIMKSTSEYGVENYALLASGTSNDRIDVIRPPRHFSRVWIQFKIKTFLYRMKLKKAIRHYDIVGAFTSPVAIYRFADHPWIKESDIIHIHWVGGFLDYESFFTKVKKPIVWTLHDENPGLGGFHYSYWRDKSTDKGRKMEQAFVEIKKKAYSQINSMYLVAVSSKMKDFVKKNELLQKFPHILIPNGVDDTIFFPVQRETARGKMHIDENRKVFLFIAENLFEDRKGLRELIQAMERLNLPNSTLLCLGRCQNPPQSSVDIRCEGFVADQYILSLYYSAADYVVMPSYQEAFSQISLEAMACGTPVIVFPCSGAADLIRPFNGVVCNDFTVEALVEAIRKAMVTQYNRSEIREDIVRRYSYKVIGKRYAQLYEKILKDKE